MSQQQQIEFTPQWEYTSPSSKGGKRRIFKVVLYIVGIFIAECSLLSISFTIFGPTSNLNWMTFFIAFGTLGGSLIFFFRKKYKAPCLPWMGYVWWIFGATIGAIMAFILEASVILNPKDLQLPTAILGCILLLYGIALVAIAHFQPTLLQQINESTMRILHSMPGNQIALADLINRLQKEYRLADTVLTQYIGELHYLSLVQMPGTNTKMCLLRGAQSSLSFPQVDSIETNALKQKVQRALQFLNEDNVDIGLFLLSKEFEAMLKTYLINASAKGNIQIPIQESPDRWKLDHMIGWVAKNGIITDQAVLNYLRQTRNDRAHGGMPSVAERRILMMGIQYLTNLYIDYIMLFDDLIRNL